MIDIRKIYAVFTSIFITVSFLMLGYVFYYSQNSFRGLVFTFAFFVFSMIGWTSMILLSLPHNTQKEGGQQL